MVTTNQLVSPVINKHEQSSLFTDTHTNHAKTSVDIGTDTDTYRRDGQKHRNTQMSDTNTNVTFQCNNDTTSAKTGTLKLSA